ncbi:MAG: helix-hairpin-helix domain-containing protein, partial [Candidatus Pacearchaeota archaeon]|nr:helix-hairpin-helix domain-containing protein [Candidatus Pacearchaeota archaeon]
MKGLAALFILVLFLTNISALCKDGQVDINSASAEELDKIAQIGPARAEQMITLRPFSSVDDMIRIDGIGENNINLIKSQGLACVDEETEITEE